MLQHSTNTTMEGSPECVKEEQGTHCTYDELKAKLKVVLKYMDSSLHSVNAICNLAFGIYKDFVPEVVSTIDLGKCIRNIITGLKAGAQLSLGDMRPSTWVEAFRSAITVYVEEAKIAWVFAAVSTARVVEYSQSDQLLTNLGVLLDSSVSENEYDAVMRGVISLYIVMAVNRLIQYNEIGELAFSDVLKEYFND